VVWLAYNGREDVALKQIAKSDRASYATGRKEIKIGQAICPAMTPNSCFLPVLEAIDDKRDLWIAFRLGGNSLGKRMFEIKGEFVRSERVYRVNHLPWMCALNQSFSELKAMLRDMCEAL
jgi:hypothetical protein